MAMLFKDDMANYEGIVVHTGTNLDGKGTGWERTTHVKTVPKTVKNP